MEERRCDLIGREKNLRDKITTMERSIPALIAYNMWMAKDKCLDSPYCKIRDMMRQFSGQPDPTEQLLASLKKTVKELNQETSELHEKIIQADVKLEETDMELESLELMNKETNVKLTSLENEVNSYVTPSLHSIHSEDLICLSKIRQLAKEELCLKHCIRQLEQKETLFKEHMDRLLTSREYQSMSNRRKIVGCLQDVPDCGGKRICCLPKMQKEKEIPVFTQTQTQCDAGVSTSDQNVSKQDKTEGTAERSSWISNWWSGNRKSDQVAQKNVETTPSGEDNEKKVTSEQPSKKTDQTSSCKPCKREICPPPHSTRTGSKKGKNKLCAGKLIGPCNVPCMKPFKGCSNSRPPRKPFCDIPRCLIDHGIRSTCKSFGPLCDLGGPCEICPLMTCKDYLQPTNNCRCNCKGQCASGLSTAECNCSDALEEYQPTASQLHKSPNADDGNTDDEYCECCSCGCEDSDASYSCQCY
ncbi:hypothetical protein WN55_02526 [Dufourea novaeangliae]|uniref:Uncharacterized protein n=1 Tax=Dufourea novaeangliae TaxID=178035 RepID=A0A154PH29_DUFNO|nr:hypothetical protein WN55_02526 [Dufourea novaeangliae]